MIRPSVLLWCLATLVPAYATTVRSASLDELIQLSSSVVRGQVVASSTALKGSLIYTHYTVQVLDQWKGLAMGQVDVQIPGGTLGAMQQSIAGAPQLTIGSQYIFFLWTAPSGANLPLGLSQGVLNVTSDTAGNTTVIRPPSEVLALNPVSGASASQDPLQMKLADFASRISSAVKGGSNTK
jgi:hypothetical protein